MSITVVIPSYKYGHLVSHATESVLAQTRQADRIIVCDDGAGDIHKRYDGVEYIIRPENLGIVDNFNDLLNQVTTDYVLFLGGDNYLREDTLFLLESVGGHTQADIVSYDIALFGTEVDSFIQDNVLQTDYKNGFHIWKDKLHGSSLYKVELAKKVGGYKASGNVKSEEDSVLFSKMLKQGAKREHVIEPLLFYRRHKDNFQ